MPRQTRKVIAIIILAAFISTSVKSPAYAQLAQDQIPRLPAPGAMVHLSPEFTPAHLQGLTIHPDNALQFDFLINRGDNPLSDEQKKEQYRKLVKYFLASLTIPDEDQWVNLSPYEKNRIIKEDFGKTEMGRDLLAEDYMLKQITSSLIYPEDGLGKQFWDKVYARAWKEFGTTNVPVNTFNKVWIIPDEAAVYESGNTVYVLRNHLKVMLEEDYLSLAQHNGVNASPSSSVIPAPSTNGRSPEGQAGIHNKNNINALGSQIIKEIILPELEREVNEGKNFATLRQIYSGMILATWYKHALKESLLGKVYANQAKVKGVDQNPQNNQIIYQQYLKAFKKGVFNYIKEDIDKYTNETIPRKYFSGGAVDFAAVATGADTTSGFRDARVLVFSEKTGIPGKVRSKIDFASVAQSHIDRATIELYTPKDKDAAMATKDLNISLSRRDDNLSILNNTKIVVEGEPYSLFEFFKIRITVLALLDRALETDDNHHLSKLFDLLLNSNGDLKIENPLDLDFLQEARLINEGSDILSARYMKLINFMVEVKGWQVTVTIPEIGTISVDKFVGISGALEKLSMNVPSLFKKFVEFVLFSGTMSEEEKDQIKQFLKEDGNPYDEIKPIMKLIVRVSFEKKKGEIRSLMTVDEYESFYRSLEDTFNGTEDRDIENEIIDEFSTIKNTMQYVLISKIENPLTIDAAMNSQNLTPSQSLYQKALDAMAVKAIGSYSNIRRDVRRTHHYVWEHQAEFAGELLGLPATFEMGHRLLEESYQNGITIGWRYDSEGEVNQSYTVASEVVKQMGRHPDLRQRALEIIFDPRTYGLNQRLAQRLEATREAIGPQRQLTFASPRIKPILKDSKTISMMRELIFVLIQSIANDDTELSNRLLGTFMMLRQWQIEATKAEGREWYEYMDQDIEKLSNFKVLWPKLVEIADGLDNEEQKGNWLFYLYAAYARAGQPTQALKILSKANKITHSYNRPFTETSRAPKLRAVTLNQIRRIGGVLEVEKLIAVADVTFSQGNRREAEAIYQEAWRKSKVSRDEYYSHTRNMANHFVEISRRSGITFGGSNELKLLEQLRQRISKELQKYNSSKHPGHWFTDLVEQVIFELSRSGLYEQAEGLVTLLDQKTRIERWGFQAIHHRPEERDIGYRAMTIGAAHRQDYGNIEKYLRRMIEFDADVLLEIIKIFGQKGDFANSFITSALGANQVTSKGGITRDKDDIGAAQRILFTTSGEPLYRIGLSMLNHGEEIEKIGKIFVKAAEIGLGDFELRDLMQTIRNHPQLKPYVINIFGNVLHHNSSIITHHVILQALREFFPELTDFTPQVNVPADKAMFTLDKKINNITPGGIDLNAANLNLQIKRDGKGVPLPLAQQDMAQLSRIQGFEPEIIEIKPAGHLPIISELQQKLQSPSPAMASVTFRDA